MFNVHVLVFHTVTNLCIYLLTPWNDKASDKASSDLSIVLKYSTNTTYF